MNDWNNPAKARVLYDFEAQPNSGEISVKVGEILTIGRQDVGEGWWEGTNDRGQSGLFPECYVEILPPITHNSHVTVNKPIEPATPNAAKNPPSYTQVMTPEVLPPPVGLPPPPPAQFGGDDGMGGWSDDSWDSNSESSNPPAPNESQYSSQMMPIGMGHGGMGGGGGSIIGSSTNVSGTQSKSGTVRKSYNRFSNFVKSGGEDFILGTKNKRVPADSYIKIDMSSSDNYVWACDQPPYSCTVASPKKETKLKGLKSFIAYQLTPTLNNIQVSRRYKHFDWLHGRLEEKFMSIPIPPLPTKQITGRFQGEFVEHRRKQLERWVNRICRHPVLSQCEVWIHFLTCGPEEKRWKSGKRRAERDEFICASFFFTVQPPEHPLSIQLVEKRVDHFKDFVGRMDDTVKGMMQVSLDQSKKYPTSYAKDGSKMGMALHSLVGAFESSGGMTDMDRGLNEALKYTGTIYDTIGKMYEDEPKCDWEPLADALYEYKGLLASWPEILGIHKKALDKKKQHFRLEEEGKIDREAAESVGKRADIISYAILAEMDHFQKERTADFKLMMQDFLNNQIRFYQDIVTHLQEALSLYDRF